MRSITGATSRALISVAVTGAAMSIGLLSGAATGVGARPGRRRQRHAGQTAVVTFRVPGESETGALTTQLNVALPDVASARTEVMPGWTARLDRDVAAGTVRSVTWTAAPGTGISSDQFALFRVSVKLPEGGETVSFPTTQTYSDGTVVRWDQAMLADGREPEYPAPVLTLSGAPTQPRTNIPPRSRSHRRDNPARWLAGGALTVAAVAVAARITGAAAGMKQLVAVVVLMLGLAVGALGGAGPRRRTPPASPPTPPRTPR